MDGWMDGWMDGRCMGSRTHQQGKAEHQPGDLEGRVLLQERPAQDGGRRHGGLLAWSICLFVVSRASWGGGGGVPNDREWGHKRRVVNRFLTLKLANDDAVISAFWLAHFRNGQGVRPLCERGGNQDGGGGGDRRDVRLSRPHFRACGPDGVVAARWGRACRRLQPTRKRGGHNGHSTVRLAEQWR